MNRTIWIAALLTAAGCAALDRPCLRCGCCPVTKDCRAEPECVEDERTCYYTECEEICIPPVHVPCCLQWLGIEPDRVPRCGTVIAVERLKSEDVVWRRRTDANYKLVSPCCRCPQCQCSKDGKECRCGVDGTCPYCGGHHEPEKAGGEQSSD
jgi:hypothetical protein